MNDLEKINLESGQLLHKVLTLESHADVASDTVPCVICRCIHHICISKGEATKLMRLGNGQIAS